MDKIDINKIKQYVNQDVKELESLKEIYYIVREYALRVPRINLEKMGKLHITMNRENVIKTVLSFYESIDKDMYEQSKDILMEQNETPIFIYPKYVAKKEKLPEDARVETIKKPYYIVQNGREIKQYVIAGEQIAVPIDGDIRDVYVLAHELSHTMDSNPNNLRKNSLLGEITPDCIENIMDYYLLRKGTITESQVMQRRLEKANGIRFDCIKILARMELAKTYIEKEGLLDESSIRMLLEKYKISEKDFFSILKDLLIDWENIKNGSGKIEYMSRYILADLVTSPYFQKIYENNPEKAIEMLKDFQTKMKEGKSPKECMGAFGLDMNMETLTSLIDNKIRYVHELESKTRQDSDELLR